MTQVKICGVTTPDALDAAIQENADFIGFVFYQRSPRALTPHAAAHLINRLPSHIKAVGLFVDADDDLIGSVLSNVKLDMLQLHGSEQPDRIADLKSRYNLPVMKAIKISAPEDMIILGPVQAVADWVLFDAKPPSENALPGGNGEVFDWQLLKNLKIPKPWMLSGGLTPENIGAALDTLNPLAVDVSSGVEDLPGIKNPDKIRSFIRAVKQA